MVKRINIKNWHKVFTELTQALDDYKEKPVLSQEFIVEENQSKNIQIRIKYPGKKVKRRFKKGTKVRKNVIPWANLYDFLVIPYVKGKAEETNRLQWRNLLKDFYENKMKSKKFWKLLEAVYKYNDFNYMDVPKLNGIDSELFLMLIKWLWIQEDLNYKYNSKNIPHCPTRYRNETKAGSATKGVGRGKFYAALLLVKYHGFTAYEVGRIIP